MDILTKLNLDLLRTNCNVMAFNHFNLPVIDSISFYHELAHLIQFKLNEIERWNTGKLIFYVKFPGYRNLIRETATEAIEYNLSKYFTKHSLSEYYYKYDDEYKDRLSKNFKKKYTKRLIKKRAKYISKWLIENKQFVLKRKSVCKKYIDLIAQHSSDDTVVKIIKTAFKQINNCEWQEFELKTNENMDDIINVLFLISLKFRIINTNLIEVFI